jgi:translation initiation factor IF-2
MRVYELAKELGVDAKKLRTRIAELGMKAASNFSTMSDGDVAIVRKDYEERLGIKKAPARLTQRKSSPAKKPKTPKAPAKKSAAKATVEDAAPVSAPLKSSVAKARAKPAPTEDAPAEPKTAPRKGAPRKKAPAEAAPVVEEAPVVEKTSEAPAAPVADEKPPVAPVAEKKKSKTPAPAAKKPAAKKPEAAPKSGAPAKAPDGKAPVTPADSAAGRKSAKRRRGASRRRSEGRDSRDSRAEPIVQKPGMIHATPIPGARKTPMRRRGMRRPRKLSTIKQGPRQTEFTVETPISMKNLSAIIGVKTNQIIFKLMQAGIMVTINAPLDNDIVELIAQEFKLTIHCTDAATAEQTVDLIEQADDSPEDMEPRAPVVTFLGHVDHGKTTLMDKIRQADVVSSEHGGITQHISAYRVTVGENIAVFLDTPGHEAFTAMRSRGANVTDIATLIVAADDGVMPQTEEAIDHAKAAGVPIVVAINKCDRPEANPDRVKQQLTNLGLQPEEWGGDTVCVEVSAITGDGVDDLMEMLSLVAEMKELKANPKRPARGTVLEAEVSESHGPIATVLIQDGTLRVGDVVVAGRGFGKVKTLIDDHGRAITEAGPACPVTVVGLSETPDAGDRIVVMRDIQQARAVAEERADKQRETAVAQRTHVSLENFFESLEEGEVRELVLLLKADVRGTLEALSQMIGQIKSPEVKVNILRASVGGITTSDILLADASDAIIIGMNVGVDGIARSMADIKGVSIRTYNVIYRVKEEIERALVGLLKPKEMEVICGHVEVRRIFSISRYGNVAGCQVTDGLVSRNNRIRLIRDGKVIHEGRLNSLRREKDDVREVRDGFECGVLIEGYNDVKVGDIVEFYRVDKIARTLADSVEDSKES